MRNLCLPAAASALALLSGCAAFSSSTPSQPPSPVAAVQTDYSLGLSCLGQRIDRSGRTPLQVFVDPINDLTVPRNFEDRRLSSGGKWWLMTALQKLKSNKIRVVTDDGSKADPRNPSHLVLSGAWTQDDLEIGGQEGGFKAWLPRVVLDLGARRSFDVIAGDFVSTRNGNVAHASAISVQVNARQAGMGLQVEDGDRKFVLAFSQRQSEGPQFAQRRIAEAAVMVHMARAFGVDYQPCIAEAQGVGDPG